MSRQPRFLIAFHSFLLNGGGISRCTHLQLYLQFYYRACSSSSSGNRLSIVRWWLPPWTWSLLPYRRGPAFPVVDCHRRRRRSNVTQLAALQRQLIWFRKAVFQASTIAANMFAECSFPPPLFSVTIIRDNVYHSWKQCCEIICERISLCNECDSLGRSAKSAKEEYDILKWAITDETPNPARAAVEWAHHFCNSVKCNAVLTMLTNRVKRLMAAPPPPREFFTLIVIKLTIN